MVKLRTSIQIIVLCMFLFSCGGGGPVIPSHLTSGMNDIQSGNAWYQRGCYERALEYYFMAYKQFSASDQVSGVAMSMNNIGNVYRAMGDDVHAISFFDGSYNIYSDLQDNEQIVRVLSNKAALLLDKGDLKRAESMMDRAETIHAGNGVGYFPLRKNRAILLIHQKAYAPAEEILTALLETVNPESRQEWAAVHGAMGRLMAETRRPEKAIEYFKTALDADQYTGFHKGMADDLKAIADAYLQLEDDASAGEYYQRSLKIYAQIGEEKKVKHIMTQMERISQQTGIDIGITTYFVDKWLSEGFDGPCD